eukprot:XP_001695814.1 predicted protein [Chlamydomonas reinhardtii]
MPILSAGRSLLAAGGQSACAQQQGGSDPCFPGKCQGKSGSDFSCTCPSGYKVAASNKKCDGTETGADADPCASVDWESVDACVYANSQLSVTCKSGFDSYNSNSKKCRDIDECDGFDRATVASCTNSKGSYTVICKPGFHDYDTNSKTCTLHDCAPDRRTHILGCVFHGPVSLAELHGRGTFRRIGGNTDTNTLNQYAIKLAANPAMSLNYIGSFSDDTAKPALSSDVASMRTWILTSRTVGQYTSFTLVGTNRCIVVDYPSFHVRTCIAFQAQTLYVYAAVV